MKKGRLDTLTRFENIVLLVTILLALAVIISSTL